MNNASIIIWSTSTLGLRTCAPYQSLSPLCSKFKIFKESSGTGRQCTRRGLHSSSSWVEPRIHNSSTRLGSYGCLLQHGEDFSRASSRGTRPSFLPSNDLTAGVRWQSTKPNISGVSPPRRDIGKPTGQIPYLSRKKIAELFGPGVTVEASNNVIRKLQKQRESGTLDEGIIAPGFDDTLVQKALLWLRETYPIDEDAAILRRIEEEEKEAQTFKPQQNADPNNVYGKSAFDAIRERNIKAAEEKKAAKKKAEEEALAAKIKENPNAALVEPAGGRAVLDRRRDSAEWVKRYKEKAQIAMEFSPLTAREKFWRLLPPVMFCGVVIWFCVMLAQNYEPPIRKARLFPDMPPAAATVIALIVTNSFFFIVWRLPPMWRFMNTFFMMIAAKPRSFSLLGNVFSHQNPLHLLGNMCVLWFVGTRVHDDVGRGNFLAIYFSCGVLSSLASLSWSVLLNRLTTTSLGASGALCGLIAAWCCIHAGEHVAIRFLPENWTPILEVEYLLGLIIFLELYAAYKNNMMVDHRAHLGGYATGYAAALVMKHRAKRRKELNVSAYRNVNRGVLVK